MDPAIHAALALAVRLAEKEDQDKRTAASALLVSRMRQAAGVADVYALRPAQLLEGPCPHCGGTP